MQKMRALVQCGNGTASDVGNMVGSSASGEVGQSMNMKFAIELKYKLLTCRWSYKLDHT